MFMKSSLRTISVGVAAVSFAMCESALSAPTTLDMADGTFVAGQYFATASSTNAYLNSYGISVSGLTSGTSLQLFDARFSYNADPYGNPNGSAMKASSNYNTLVQIGTGLNPASYTLTFDGPITDLSFYRAGASLGAATPEWAAYIFDGATQISSVGQGLNGYCCSSAPQLYSFHASDYGHAQIASMRIYSNNYHFAAFESVAIDDLTFTPAIPEPETYAMLLAGLGLLGFAARRRKQKELAAA